jgi:thiamine pyrophosphate-dependent acetolactate synthase large subunit-like protein
LARSFGIEATRVSEPRGLQRKLEVALTRGAPCLIEVQLEPGSENDPKRPCRLVRSTVAWRLSDAIATAKSFAAHSR